MLEPLPAVTFNMHLDIVKLMYVRLSFQIVHHLLKMLNTDFVVNTDIDCASNVMTALVIVCKLTYMFFILSTPL